MVGIPSRHSLREILVWLAALGTLSLLLASAFIFFRASEVSSATEAAVDLYEPASENAASLALANSEMERGVSLYVLGGQESDLLPFVVGERTSAVALADLDRALGRDKDVGPLIGQTATARQRWLDEVGRPAIRFVRRGNAGQAEKTLTQARSQQLYTELLSSTARLSDEINAFRTAAFRDIAAFSNQLKLALFASLAVLIGSIVMALLILLRWVLTPLENLSTQMRDVARRGNHDRPITPIGPRELAGVGADAETMRRQLVTEIDEARSAREALALRAPLVEAIRRELSMTSDPEVRGLLVHGEIQPAEGVLAGDWWDCVAMPSGEVALIVTDISGHGPEAGVAAMRLKHLLEQSLISGVGPDEAMSVATRKFSDDVGRFATVAIMCVRPETGALRWANAGHLAPFILRADGRSRELDPTGPLLSWIGGDWEIREDTLEPGDFILAFTDGLTESHDASGSELQTSGLLDLLPPVLAAGPNPKELVKRILATTRERAVDWDRDDVTVVAMALEGSPIGTIGRQRRGSVSSRTRSVLRREERSGS